MRNDAGIDLRILCYNMNVKTFSDADIAGREYVASLMRAAGLIVRVKDAAILKRLQESPKTRNITIEPLGPTAARINEKDWPKLVSILAEAGVLVD